MFTTREARNKAKERKRMPIKPLPFAKLRLLKLRKGEKTCGIVRERKKGERARMRRFNVGRPKRKVTPFQLQLIHKGKKSQTN